ncbi:hypothetical protein EHM69_01240 [candidate division KSB1 bacterium]|nr:MAG: hypothetical protein EHM69_01240 [candidate division KSB1 bacterium]
MDNPASLISAEELSALETAAKQNPTDADAQAKWGGGLCRAGKFTEGVAALREAIRMDGTQPLYRLLLALTLRETGDFETALQELEGVVRMAPDIPEVHYELGVTWAILGNAGSAVSSLEEAVRLSPDFAEAQYNLSIVKLLTGDAEGSNRAQAVLQKLDPAAGAELQEKLNRLTEMINSMPDQA